MLCSNCAKLNSMHTKKNCIKCQGEVLNNISVLCEFCSLTEKQCAACLRKIFLNGVGKPNARGCNCGRK